MNKRSIKLVEVILACCCLGIKYKTVGDIATSGLLVLQKNLDLNVLLLCLTYYGYVYLLSIFAMSAISGQPPSGVYVKYFNILGAVLYIMSEMLLFTSVWTVIQMFGLVFAIMLIVLLILDGLNIVF